MTLVSHDHVYLEAVAPDKLAALIFELSSQLHIERRRRIALEAMLERAGVIERSAIDCLSGDGEIAARGDVELDQAMLRLLRIVSEAGAPQGPLRTPPCCPGDV